MQHWAETKSREESRSHAYRLPSNFGNEPASRCTRPQRRTDVRVDRAARLYPSRSSRKRRGNERQKSKRARSQRKHRQSNVVKWIFTVSPSPSSSSVTLASLVNERRSQGIFGCRLFSFTHSAFDDVYLLAREAGSGNKAEIFLSFD